MTEVGALAVLTFETGGMRLAIELPRVVEISLRAEVTPLPGVSRPVTGVLRWRGRALMAVDLCTRLHAEARDPELFDHFIVVRTDRRMVALEVERVVDVSELSIAEIRGAPPSARPLAGIVPLADGVHYVVDLDALLDIEDERAFDAALAATEAER